MNDMMIVELCLSRERWGGIRIGLRGGLEYIVITKPAVSLPTELKLV